VPAEVQEELAHLLRKRMALSLGASLAFMAALVSSFMRARTSGAAPAQSRAQAVRDEPAALMEDLSNTAIHEFHNCGGPNSVPRVARALGMWRRPIHTGVLQASILTFSPHRQRSNCWLTQRITCSASTCALARCQPRQLRKVMLTDCADPHCRRRTLHLHGCNINRPTCGVHFISLYRRCAAEGRMTSPQHADGLHLFVLAVGLRCR
jgi:hypothetical protein